MAASYSSRQPSAADLAALDEVLADLDLRETNSSSSPLTIVSTASSLATVVVASQPSELEAFYRPMDKARALELQSVAARIKERDRIARVGIIDTGNDLIAIKNSIPGQFDRWLKVEFDMSKATAWNYINAAQRFGSAPKVVEVLPPGTVYKLAASATPEAIREKIVAEIESGELPSKDDVERRIAVARTLAADEERKRKQAERDQVEAERQRREDEQAWQERANELADAGKTEKEILKDRKKWDTVKEAKRRAKERTEQKREDDEKRRQSEWEAENERKDNDAKRVANWLLAALGRDKFEEFRAKLSDAIADPWSILSAVENMAPASIQAASVVVAEEKATTEAAVSTAGVGSATFGSF
jgi:hypothetical protein